VVLLGGTLLSLAVSLLMTNNYGGFAAGFRHATYLAPAMLLLLLPVFASRRKAASAARLALLTLSGASAIALFLITTPRPFYPYTFPPEGEVVAAWQRYLPVVAQVVGRINRQVDEFGKPLASPPAAPE
jgi:hypothetical protein